MNTWINKINMVSRSRQISSTRIDLRAESNQQATQPTDTRSEKPHNFFTAHRNGLVHTQRTWARTPSRLDTSEPCDFTPPRHVQTSPLDHLQPLRKNVRNIPDSKSLPLHRREKKKIKNPSWIIKKEPWTVWRSTNKRTPHTNWSEKGGGWGREALQQGSHFHVQPPSLTLLNDLELPWASGVTTGHSSLLEEEKQRRQTGSCSSRSLMYISSSP